MLLHSCKFTLCHLQELESFYRGVHAADAGPALPRRCSCRRRIPLACCWGVWRWRMC